jgi:hypothetical protein
VAMGFPAGAAAAATLGVVGVYGIGLSVLWPLLGGEEGA